VVAVETKTLLRYAYELARESHDKSTHVGAIIVKCGQIMAHGINHFTHDAYRYNLAYHERPLKYRMLEHAERDAIYQAARHGRITLGATLICPWATCSDCARAIVLAGIRCVIGHKQAHDKTPQRWRDELAIGLMILRDAHVDFQLFDGKIGDTENLFDGEIWYP
jgi:dCMP deaminase